MNNFGFGQGTSTSSITGGDISSILTGFVNPLIQSASSAYLAQQQLKLQQDLLKRQQAIPQQPILIPPPQTSQQTLIIIIVVIVFVVALLIILSGRKGSSSGISISSDSGKLVRKIVRRRPST